MLWLALTLPRLPLDVFALAQPRSEPWAVVDASGRVDRVVACNDAARLAGIAQVQGQAVAGPAPAPLPAPPERAANPLFLPWAGTTLPGRGSDR